MVAGNGMMYNHQDDNNAETSFNFTQLYADIIALKPIKSGEEIFVNYGEEYFKNIPKKSLKDVISDK
jgi:SET domain-containing protein